MLLGGPIVLYLIQKVAWYILHLAVKSSEEIGVPWSFRLLAGVVPLACSRLLSVNQVVGVIAQYFADDERAFPRRRQLVLAGCSLDQPEHKVTFLQRSWPDLPIVVSAQALLVDAGPTECQQPALFQQIGAVLSCFFCFLLGVHGDSWGVKLYVRWDDNFGTVDKEEGREAG